MRLIARKFMVTPQLLTPSEYMAEVRGRELHMDYKDIISRGEPYFYGSHKPLIFALGRGTHWKQVGTKFPVYGEGIDPDTIEQFDDVLASRRKGDIYGHWYSEYVIDGETGFASHRNCIAISSREFLLALQNLKAKT